MATFIGCEIESQSIADFRAEEFPTQRENCKREMALQEMKTIVLMCLNHCRTNVQPAFAGASRRLGLLADSASETLAGR
jgi:hypothetical protein